MQDIIEYQETKLTWRRYFKISKNGHLHVMVPYTSGGLRHISQDNTCNALLAAEASLKSVDHRNSILYELTQFKVECAGVIQRHASNTKASNLVTQYKRLVQEADWYIAALTALTTHNNSLECLVDRTGTQGEHIEAMKSLFQKKNRNVFTMRLNPATRDTFIKTIAPVFSIERSDSSPVCKHFRAVFKTLKLSPTTPLAILRDTIATKCIKNARYAHKATNLENMIPDISNALKQSGLFYVASKKDGIRGSIEQGDLRSTARYQPGLDEVFKNADELGGWLRNIMQSFSPQYPRCSPFQEVDIYANEESDMRARSIELDFILQFFLGEVTAYAHFLQLTERDFAKVLEQNLTRFHITSSLSDQIAKAVSDALVNNTSAETAVLNMIHANLTTFGMSRKFTEEECQKIIKQFRQHYLAIEDHKEKDEFTLHFDQPPGKVSTSFALGNFMSFHLIELLEQAPYNTKAAFLRVVDRSSNAGEIAKKAQTAFDTLRKSAIRTDIATLPSTLSNADHMPIQIVKTSLADIRAKVQRHIQEKKNHSFWQSEKEKEKILATERIEKIEGLKILLFKTLDGQYIFNLLGSEFFKDYYTNKEAQKLLKEVLNEFIADPQAVAQFQQVVCGVSTVEPAEEEAVAFSNFSLELQNVPMQSMQLDTLYLQALQDQIELLDTSAPEVLATYAEGQERLEALLIILGFRFRTICYLSIDNVLIIETDKTTEERIRKIIQTIYQRTLNQLSGPGQRHDSAISEVELAPEYTPALIPGWKTRATVEAIRQELHAPPPAPSSSINRRSNRRIGGSSPFKICLAIASITVGAALTAASFLIYLQNPVVAPLLLLNIPITVMAITLFLGLCMIKFGINLLRGGRPRGPEHDARLFGRRNNDIETGNINPLYSPSF